MWFKRFKSYARALKLEEGHMCDAMLSLPDDAAFRAYDLLGLGESDAQDYKLLCKALADRFATVTGEPELRFQFGRRLQKQSESFDEFADALINLVNRAYPTLDPTVRMNLARDRFIAGVKADFIQEELLTTAPSTLEDARKKAKELEAARSARKQMQSGSGSASILSTTTQAGAQHGVELEERVEISALSTTRECLLQECVLRNTELLEQLTKQIAQFQDQPPNRSRGNGRPRRRSVVRCWTCGQLGHVRQNCTKARSQETNSISPGAIQVKGCVDEKETTILIDTGSAVSIVERSFIGGHRPLDGHGTSLTVFVANGEPLKILGSIQMSLKISRSKWEHVVLVTDDISHDCLLGTDFLIAHKFNIDSERNKIFFSGDSVAIHTDKNSPKREVCRVAVSSTTVLRNHEERLLWAEVQHPQRGAQVNYCGIVEPRTEKLEKYPFLIARVLAQPGKMNIIPVRIINLSDSAITIYKGQTIGNFCPAFLNLGYSSRKEDIHHKEISKSRLVNNVNTGYSLPKIEASMLTVEQNRAAQDLLNEYANLFSQGKQDLGRTDLTQHRIDTGMVPPIKQAARRMPFHKKREVIKLVKDMESQGIIQPSQSAWASPIVLVQKKDGSVRFCIDYHKLNEVTKKDSYPLPRVDDLLDSLGGAQWFSTLDLASGYWQVQMDPASKEKTAFSTPLGLYEFNVMPFGLCNAPGTFQRLMELILAGLEWETCLIYLDDVIVFGHSFEEHLERL